MSCDIFGGACSLMTLRNLRVMVKARELGLRSNSARATLPSKSRSSRRIGGPVFSELDLVRLLGPQLIDGAGLLSELGLLDHRNDLALIEWPGELFVKRLVAETDGAGVVHRQDIIGAIDAGPKHARHTHAARSAVGIKLAAAQVERLELGACAPHRQQFGVRRRVVTRQHFIVRFADDDPVLDDHAAERAAMAGLHALTATIRGRAS